MDSGITTLGMPLWPATGLLGLLVGRFLCVLAWAVPDRMVVRRAVGRVPGCGCPIDPWDILPVMWWVRRRVACRSCEVRIDPVYPVTELVAGVLFAGAAGFLGLQWSLPAYLWFLSVTVVLGAIDVRRRLIPNRILLPGTVVGVALLAGAAWLDGRGGDLPEALLSGLGYFSALLAPALLTRGAIGMGDVKLAFLLGVFAGYGSWQAAVTAGIGAFVLAASGAILLILFRVLTRHDDIPFGPFMVTAVWTAIAMDFASGAGFA